MGRALPLHSPGLAPGGIEARYFDVETSAQRPDAVCDARRSTLALQSHTPAGCDVPCKALSASTHYQMRKAEFARDPRRDLKLLDLKLHCDVAVAKEISTDHKRILHGVHRMDPARWNEHRFACCDLDARDTLEIVAKPFSFLAR